MLRTVRFILILLATTTFCTNVFAQESASSLAKRLEDQLLSGAGVLMKFTVRGVGPVSLMADIAHKKTRLESPTSLIISDGTTVWNYQKDANRATIDNVAGISSPFHDPKMIFEFAENYSAAIVSHSGSMYNLELTPNPNLRALTEAAGEVQKLQLDINVHGKNIRIVKATASSSRGTSQVSALVIKPLTTIRASDFVFKPKPGVKILDLRE